MTRSAKCHFDKKRVWHLSKNSMNVQCYTRSWCQFYYVRLCAIWIYFMYSTFDHNDWQILWLPSLVCQKIVPLKDSIASKLHGSSFFHLPHSVAKCFQISPPSPLPKYLNYFGQCQTNHLRLITFRHHFWNHVPTLSPSSSHTWQIDLSPRPLFHPKSSWHLSHPCWKNLVYQNSISHTLDHR